MNKHDLYNTTPVVSPAKRGSMATGTVQNRNHLKESSAACPNSADGAHRIITAPATRLSNDKVRDALASINIRPGSPLLRSARYHASRADIEADDLLQEALSRAITTRTCPAHVGIERYVSGIMRSIATDTIRRRERDRKPCQFAIQIEKERVESASPSPADELARHERAKACQAALALVAGGRLDAERVIDGLGEGLRGQALANFAGLGQDELGSVRRLISRRAARVWTEIPLLDKAA